jgi:hypothetical protein
MQKASTALLLTMVISCLSLWGCSNQKNSATNVKIRELENRHAKLEEDYRVMLAANESGRRKLVLLEAQRAELTHKIDELVAVVKERDELKTQLEIRTEERDSAQLQFAQFSKDLQNLASRAQAATRSLGGIMNASASTSRKSQ